MSSRVKGARIPLVWAWLGKLFLKTPPRVDAGCVSRDIHGAIPSTPPLRTYPPRHGCAACPVDLSRHASLRRAPPGRRLFAAAESPYVGRRNRSATGLPSADSL